MGRKYLYVPFEERDEAMRHGARWDPDAKCCFIDSELDAELDTASLRRWLGQRPAAADPPYSIVCEQAYIVSTRIRCWKCAASIRVACLYCESGRIDGEPYEHFTVSNITAVDDALRRQLEPFSELRFAYSRDGGGRFLVNHCPRCRAQQADYYLHCEPSGAFFSLKDAPAGAFEIVPLAGPVRLTGDEGFEP